MEPHIRTHAVGAEERTGARVPHFGGLRWEQLSKRMLRRKVKRSGLGSSGVDVERSVPLDEARRVNADVATTQEESGNPAPKQHGESPAQGRFPGIFDVMSMGEK